MRWDLIACLVALRFVLIVVRIFRLKDEDAVKHQADACEYLDDVPWIGSRDEVSIDLERDTVEDVRRKLARLERAAAGRGNTAV